MLVILERQTLEGWVLPDPPPPPPIPAPALPLDLPRGLGLVLGSDNAFVVSVTLIAIREMSVPLEVRLIAFMPGGVPVVVAGPEELAEIGETVALDSGLVSRPFGRVRLQSTAGRYVFSVALRTYRR